MTSPAVPYRMEVSVEVAGTPEQVWDAIATGGGISSWFLPTVVEEREGGAIVLALGGDSSTGTITGWDPPRRFAYEEPDWAPLTGHEGAAVTPLVTEFLVEAGPGGTCIVRVVSSAFGTGADWELEFFANMEIGWTPFFHHLRLYLGHFAGQQTTRLSVLIALRGDPGPTVSAMRQALGIGDAGQAVDTHGLLGRVERSSEDHLLLHLTHPAPGYMAFFAYASGAGTSGAQIEGYLFSPDALAYVEREMPTWKAWLESLAAPRS